eukprot:1916763-Rhodomonas_salina.1
MLSRLVATQSKRGLRREEEKRVVEEQNLQGPRVEGPGPTMWLGSIMLGEGARECIGRREEGAGSREAR